MPVVKVYTTSFCAHCIRAKSLLSNKGIEFEEINLDGRDQERQRLVQETGFRTVPMIFIGDELIGGFNELAELDKSGQLDSKIAGV